MGYKLAGFTVLGGVEIDFEMMDLYRTNHNPKHSYLMGVQQFKNIPNDELPKELFDLDVLDGSPPCSSFSTAGSREKAWGTNKKFREGQAHQVLDDLFFDFIDIAKKLQPKVVVAENVKGLVTGKAKGYVKEIYQAFESAGYDVQLFLLNAAFMGVPQRRERTFFVARKKELLFNNIKMMFNESIISFGESIKDLKNEPFDNVSPSLFGAGPWMAKNKTDEVVEWAKKTMNKEKYFTCKGTFLDQPVKTLTASSRHIFYNSDRFLSDKECARIQTFPDDYKFKEQDVGYFCGMSVPPFMMQRVAHQIYEQWLKNLDHKTVSDNEQTT